MENEKKTVLITGASSGIGKALAHEFASDDYDIIAVAQHKDKLDSLVQEIKSMHGREVMTVQKDLAQDKAAQEVYDEVKKFNRTINVLVNDAGVGQHGKFVDIPVEKDYELIHLNVITTTHMTKLFLKDMVERDEGKILNLGSVAGFQPGPLMAVYHATKSFIISLSEAIATELEDMNSKVSVTCLCPGPTDTNFFSRADMENTRVYQNKDKLMMEPKEVAKGAYKALMDGDRVHIPGTSNKVTTFIRRVMPKSTQSKLQKKYYETTEE